MRRFFTLPRLAAAVWLSWTFLLLLLLGMALSRIWHPHFLPVTLALALFAVFSFWLFVTGTVQIARGPDRVRKLGLLLVGIAPVLFWTAHIMYGFKAGHGRRVRLDFFQKILIPLGESIIDLESRFRYPQRTVGEKVVMISGPVDDAAEQVREMDDHVRAMERRLGRTLDRRIHWFRGTLLGIQGKAILGVCMGSVVDQAVPDEGGLDPIDRHEVAHCFVNDSLSFSSEPPALLVEGWAQANMGVDETAAAYNAWKFRDEGQELSLEDLTGPDWAGRHEWPVYIQGAAFVNHLLRTYGAEKFLQLYATSRRAHFSNDCRRILGIELKELDKAYWHEIERQVNQGKPFSQRRLESLPVAAGVDSADWRRFVEEYWAAIPRLTAGYQRARLDVDIERIPAADRDDVVTGPARLRLLRSNDCWFAWLNDGDQDTAAIATPANSRQFQRGDSKQAWREAPHSEPDDDRNYRRIRHDCRQLLDLEEVAAVLASERWQGLQISSATVTEFVRFQEEGRRFVRVSLKWGPTSPAQRMVPTQLATCTFAEEDDFSLTSFRYESPGQVQDGVQTYEMIDGVPVVRSRLTNYSDPEGARLSVLLRVTELDAVQTPLEDFTAEKLLDGPVESDSSPHVDPSAPPRMIWDYYGFPGWAGVASVATGIALVCRRRLPSGGTAI